MKKRVTGLFASLACLLFLMTLSTGTLAAGQNRLKKTETQKYTLYPAPAKHDAYSTQYPITLQEPGLITVKAHVGGGKLTGKHPLRIWIVEAAGVHNEETNKIDRKYIKREVHFKAKDTSVSLPVDAGDLARTKGKYVIFLSNLSMDSHAVGTITITYPASGEAAASAASKQEGQPRQRHKRDEK